MTETEALKRLREVIPRPRPIEFSMAVWDFDSAYGPVTVKRAYVSDGINKYDALTLEHAVDLAIKANTLELEKAA